MLRSSVHRQALHHEAGAKDEEERFAHADTLCSHQQHARVLPFVLPAPSQKLTRSITI